MYYSNQLMQNEVKMPIYTAKLRFVRIVPKEWTTLLDIWYRQDDNYKDYIIYKILNCDEYCQQIVCFEPKNGSKFYALYSNAEII